MLHNCPHAPKIKNVITQRKMKSIEKERSMKRETASFGARSKGALNTRVTIDSSIYQYTFVTKAMLDNVILQT